MWRLHQSLPQSWPELRTSQSWTNLDVKLRIDAVTVDSLGYWMNHEFFGRGCPQRSTFVGNLPPPTPPPPTPRSFTFFSAHPLFFPNPPSQILFRSIQPFTSFHYLFAEIHFHSLFVTFHSKNHQFGHKFLKKRTQKGPVGHPGCCHQTAALHESFLSWETFQ